MNRRFIVRLIYLNKTRNQWSFTTEEEAIKFYLSKIGAIKHGLVGFTLTYPRLEPDLIQPNP